MSGNLRPDAYFGPRLRLSPPQSRECLGFCATSVLMVGERSACLYPNESQRNRSLQLLTRI
jgi:hypothetical protein